MPESGRGDSRDLWLAGAKRSTSERIRRFLAYQFNGSLGLTRGHLRPAQAGRFFRPISPAPLLAHV
jgi:hypothetical protein